MESWTIQKLLNWITTHFTEKKIDTPRLSAELLLAHVLDLKRIELYTQFNKVVEREKLTKLHELVKRAAEHEPIAYLTGKKEFYSLEFEITNTCLIPRPETELLVERAIEFLRERTSEQYICDLCTGCGCVAIAIGANFANSKIVATDISDAALEVAERNVTRYGLQNRLKLLKGDLFGPVIPGLGTARFDLITANPPYVTDSCFQNLPENIKNYEPKSALAAGPDGLDIIKRIITDAPQFLKQGAALFFEIGNEQGQSVCKLLENTALFNNIAIEKDTAKLDRLAVAFRK